MQPLKNKLPSSDKVLYIFYDFEMIQNTRYSDTATVQVPNLVCIQQFCSRCESSEDVQQDCVQCCKKEHEDPVGDMLAYLCEPQPWVRQIVAIAQNAKAFDLQFILSRAIFLKWRPEVIMNSQKNTCMTVELMEF